MEAPDPVREVLAWHGSLSESVCFALASPARTAAALAAVLQEHRVLALPWHPVPLCRACWYAADRQRPVEHPCPTVSAISGALGVPVPEVRRG
jgi:hypothetical protein